MLDADAEGDDVHGVMAVRTFENINLCTKLNVHSFDILTVDSFVFYIPSLSHALVVKRRLLVVSLCAAPHRHGSSSDIFTITIVAIGRGGTSVVPDTLFPIVRDSGLSLPRTTLLLLLLEPANPTDTVVATGRTAGRGRRTPAAFSLHVVLTTTVQHSSTTATTSAEYTTPGDALHPVDHTTSPAFPATGTVLLL